MKETELRIVFHKFKLDDPDNKYLSHYIYGFIAPELNNLKKSNRHGRIQVFINGEEIQS